MTLPKKACRKVMRQAFLLLAMLIPSLAAAQEQQTLAIRVEVSRVNVGVVATDDHGNFIEGLKQSDFHVFDNGVEQPIAGFLANDDPAQVVLMLECGPSVYFVGKQNVKKADAFLARLAPSDRVAVVCYSSSPSIESELDAGLPAARSALRDLEFHSGFAELNLDKSLLTVLGWLARVPGKKTILVVGSGIDSSPPTDPDLFNRQISASEVRVLAVSTSRQLRTFPKRHKYDLDERDDRSELTKSLKQADDALRLLTASTGGRVFFPKSTKDYEKTFAEIAQIVRHEYNLAFVPQSFDGKLHSLSVTANRAARLDHRQAYLAPFTAAK